MTKDRIFSICILIICAVMYKETYNFPTSSPYSTGPEVFPRILITIITILSLVHLFNSLISKRDTRKSFQSFHLKKFMQKYTVVIVFFVLFCLYAFLLPLLGFITATLLFIFIAQATLMGLKKVNLIILNLVVTTTSTFAVYFIFTKVLNLWLP